MLFLFLFGIVEVYPEIKIGQKTYQDILWEEDGTDFPDGSFRVSNEDFIIASGKKWQGSPPPSSGSFDYKGQTVVNSGTWNNEAVKLLSGGDKNGLQEAISRLEAGRNFDPHFFPFRYNLARAYQINRKFTDALVEFEYAIQEIPDWYKSYIHAGNLALKDKNEIYGLSMLKKAVTLNPFNTEALITLAEYFMDEDMSGRALIYLKKARETDSENPDVKLGLARMELRAGNHYLAYKLFKKTDLYDDAGKPRNYSRKFHFYFAETAFRLQDYITAAEQYSKLLEFKNDPFFADISYDIINRKLQLSRQLEEIKKREIEDNRNE